MVIKDVISQTKQQLSVATVKSDELLEALTSKATALEKLKAKLGIGSATLSAFIALIDSEIEEDDTALLQVNIWFLASAMQQNQVYKMRVTRRKAIAKVTVCSSC